MAPLRFRSSRVARYGSGAVHPANQKDSDHALHHHPPSPYGSGPNPLGPRDNGSRGPLRHILIGSPQRIRATIRHLQALRYIDHTRWTTPMVINPQQGLIIRPTPGEMYAYLELLQWQD